MWVDYFQSQKKKCSLVLFGVKKHLKTAGRGNCSLADLAPLWDENSNGPYRLKIVIINRSGMLFTSNPMRSAIPNRLAHNSKTSKLMCLKLYLTHYVNRFFNALAWFVAFTESSKNISSSE